MKQVKIFASTATNSAYADVKLAANKWLAAHPEVAIIASHVNLAASVDFTEFALTLIVEVPDVHKQVLDNATIVAEGEA